MKDAIGKFHEVKITDETPQGFWVEIEGTRILLPASQRTSPIKPGDTIRVFLYKDAKNRLIVTQKKAAGEVDDFVALKVADVNQHGAFLEWGIDKDLFVPYGEQKNEMEKGKTCVVKIAYDKKTDRLIGLNKLEELMRFHHPVFEENQSVELIPYLWHELGWKCLIDRKGVGLLYHNEVHQPLKLGDKVQGFVKKLREDDKIDLSLQPSGYSSEFVSDESERILKTLEDEGGFLDLHDKSDAEEIKAQLGMSKKTFKKVIGMLYKEKKIDIKPDGIWKL